MSNAVKLESLESSRDSGGAGGALKSAGAGDDPGKSAITDGRYSGKSGVVTSLCGVGAELKSVFIISSGPPLIWESVSRDWICTGLSAGRTGGGEAASKIHVTSS